MRQDVNHKWEPAGPTGVEQCARCLCVRRQRTAKTKEYLAFGATAWQTRTAPPCDTRPRSAR